MLVSLVPGYGHVAPKTAWGRLVTIVYALVGIPLTFLYLSNIGNFLADAFRMFYKKVCCDICCCQRCERRKKMLRLRMRRERLLREQRAEQTTIAMNTFVHNMPDDGEDDVYPIVYPPGVDEESLHSSAGQHQLGLPGGDDNLAFEDEEQPRGNYHNPGYPSQDDIRETAILDSDDASDVKETAILSEDDPDEVGPGNKRAPRSPTDVSFGSDVLNQLGEARETDIVGDSDEDGCIQDMLDRDESPSPEATLVSDKPKRGLFGKKRDKSKDKSKDNKDKKKKEAQSKVKNKKEKESKKDNKKEKESKKDKKDKNKDKDLKKDEVNKVGTSSQVPEDADELSLQRSRSNLKSSSVQRSKSVKELPKKQSDGAKLQRSKSARDASRVSRKSGKTLRKVPSRRRARDGESDTDGCLTDTDGNPLPRNPSEESFVTAQGDSLSQVDKVGSSSGEEDLDMDLEENDDDDLEEKSLQQSQHTWAPLPRLNFTTPDSDDEVALTMPDYQLGDGVEGDPFLDDQHDNGRVTVPISICLIIIAAYIFAGAVLFTAWEKWDYLTGSYFCFITLSTIGFGDIVPGTNMDEWASHTKLVSCSLWLAFGLSLLAMCFNLMQEEVKEKSKRLGKKLGILKKEDGPSGGFR